MGTRADNFYEGTTTPLSGPDVIARIQQETDSILLGFSTGKDSIAALLTLRQHFANVIPVFRHFVPGLQFVERRLAYYEDVLNTHIVRVNSTHFYRMMRNFIWQPPERIQAIQLMALPDVDYKDLNGMVAENFGLPDDTWVALGIRAADSLQRRTTCKSKGAINWAERSFWPIWDMTNEETEKLLIKHKIKLSNDYPLWGTSFDSIRWFFLKDVKARYPEDYQTILDWFPFADMELFRRTLRGGTYEK